MSPKAHPRHKKSLTGYLPEVNREKWAAMRLTEAQMNELEGLIGEADSSNMIVNEMLGRMLEILPFQVQIAEVVGVTPTVVSKRLRGLIGVMDRVNIDKLSIIGETKYIQKEEQRFPYTEKLRKILYLYGVFGTTINRLITVYISDIDRYDNPEGFFELLRTFNFSAKRAKLLTEQFFDLMVMQDVRKTETYGETEAYIL